jgi:hypothetical protein
MVWLTFLIYFPVIPLLFMAWIPDANLNHLLGLSSLLPGLVTGLVHLKQPSWRARLWVLVSFIASIVVGLMILVFGWLAISLLFASARGAQAKNVEYLMIAFTVSVELTLPILGALLGSVIASHRAPRPEN